MSEPKFKLAETANRVPKILIVGPEGSGKTLSSIRLMAGLLGKDKPFIVRDTENARASVYAGDYKFYLDEIPVDKNTPEDYLNALNSYTEGGMKGAILDGISPMWVYLQVFHSKMAGNSFQNWGLVKAMAKKVNTAILHYPLPLIVTARVKTAYTMTEIGGKQVPKKVGLAAEAEESLAYEFDLSFMIDQATHTATVEKDGMNGKVTAYMEEQGGAVKLDEEFGEFLRKVFKREV